MGVSLRASEPHASASWLTWQTRLLNTSLLFPSSAGITCPLEKPAFSPCDDTTVLRPTIEHTDFPSQYARLQGPSPEEG
jgi:hypothetical protein